MAAPCLNSLVRDYLISQIDQFQSNASMAYTLEILPPERFVSEYAALSNLKTYIDSIKICRYV